MSFPLWVWVRLELVKSLEPYHLGLPRSTSISVDEARALTAHRAITAPCSGDAGRGALKVTDRGYGPLPRAHSSVLRVKLGSTAIDVIAWRVQVHPQINSMKCIE
jgi:hypothetical protein